MTQCEVFCNKEKETLLRDDKYIENKLKKG